MKNKLSTEEKKAMREMVRENNKMAKELGYARGYKQMIKEGVLNLK